MRVLVCGGRDYFDYPRMVAVLDKIDAHLIIQGEASGADRLAKRYADEMEINCRPFLADWSKYGKGAGPIRNQQMIDEGRPDLVVAFPGGAGTADMVRRAKAASIPVTEVL